MTEEKRIRRCEQKIITPETIALRKIREYLGFDRKTAGLVLEKSPKQLEKIENGRVELTPLLIDHFLKSYQIPASYFKKALKGDLSSFKAKLRQPVIENNKLRRSYKKIVSEDVRVLAVLRKLRGLSQYNAGGICGYSKCTMGHIENGRINLSEDRIAHIVKSYGFTMKDFNQYKNGGHLIADLQEDCIEIIKKIDITKLNAVYAILKSFQQ